MSSNFIQNARKLVALMSVVSILISDTSSYKAVSIARFLKKRYKDLRIIGCDYRPLVKWIHTSSIDRYYPLRHSPKSPHYCGELQNIINRENVDVYIPMNNDEMEVLLENRNLFGEALNYWGTIEDFRTLNYKDKLMQIAQTLDIKTPTTYRSVKDAIVPLVLKPKNRSSAKGVRYFYDQDKYFEYLRTLENAEDYVIQEFVPGEGVGYSVYSQNGIILEGFGHRRIAEYPVTGGSSVYREEYQNPNMIKIVKTLLERVKWSGFAMFEFKKTENGELYLIEVNPRIWGSINQGLQNGINYFSHLLKEPVDIEKHQRIRTYLPPLIYLSLWQYLWKGRIRVVWEFIKSFPKNRSDLKLWSDPLGYLSVALRAVS